MGGQDGIDEGDDGEEEEGEGEEATSIVVVWQKTQSWPFTPSSWIHVFLPSAVQQACTSSSPDIEEKTSWRQPSFPAGAEPTSG